MSKRNRRRAIAGVGVALLIAILGIGHWKAPDEIPLPKSEQQSQGDASDTNQVTCNADCQVTFGLRRPNKEEPSEDAYNTAPKGSYSPAQIAVMDVNAQRAMAHWATVLAWLTFAGAGILILTLLETAAATDAAVKTADITRDVGQKQIRAYLGGEKAWIEKNGDDGLFLYCKIKNYGQSPAKSIEVSAELIYKTIMRKGDWPERYDPIRVVARCPKFITAGGVGSVIIHIQQHIIDQMVGIGAEDLRFYCKLAIYWEDVFWDHDDIIIELCQPVGTFNADHWIGDLVIEAREIE